MHLFPMEREAVIAVAVLPEPCGPAGVSRVKDLAVIRRHHHQGPFGQSMGIQSVEQPTELRVSIGDLSEVFRGNMGGGCVSTGRCQHLVQMVLRRHVRQMRRHQVKVEKKTLVPMSIEKVERVLGEHETLALLDEASQRFAEELSQGGPPVTAHLIEVSQHGIADAEEREFFNDVPTSLSLPADSVDRLVALARRLLRDSPEFKELLATLEANEAAREAAP